MVRFAILKKVGGVENPTTLEFDQDQILERLRTRVLENLSKNEKVVKNWMGRVKEIKREWTTEEVGDAVDEAWGDLVNEFKLLSVKIS